MGSDLHGGQIFLEKREAGGLAGPASASAPDHPQIEGESCCHYIQAFSYDILGWGERSSQRFFMSQNIAAKISFS